MRELYPFPYHIFAVKKYVDFISYAVYFISSRVILRDDKEIVKSTLNEFYNYFPLCLFGKSNYLLPEITCLEITKEAGFKGDLDLQEKVQLSTYKILAFRPHKLKINNQNFIGLERGRIKRIKI